MRGLSIFLATLPLFGRLSQKRFDWSSNPLYCVLDFNPGDDDFCKELLSAVISDDFGLIFACDELIGGIKLLELFAPSLTKLLKLLDLTCAKVEGEGLVDDKLFSLVFVCEDRGLRFDGRAV